MMHTIPRTGVLLLIVISILGISSLHAATADDLKGTWSGTFQSRYSDKPPFTITVVINSDSGGRLVGKTTHNSVCLKNLDLQVTVNGSKVSLAGSDQEGNSLTFVGALDASGTLLDLHYIINGSAGGKCETDDGTGNMAKR